MPRDIETHALIPELLLVKAWDNHTHVPRALSAPTPTGPH